MTRTVPDTVFQLWVIVVLHALAWGGVVERSGAGTVVTRISPAR